MDSKKLTEMITRISEFLDNDVLEGVSVVKFKDEPNDFDGIKIDGNLLVQENEDGEFILERMIEIEATKFDTGDVYFEEIAICETLDELFPFIKDAIEENAEEQSALAWMEYENDIEDDSEDEEDDF